MCFDRKSRVLLCSVLIVCLWYGSAFAATTYSCSDGSPHEFQSQILVLSTEEEEGQVENVCLKCGYRYIEYLPATGHKYGEWYIVEESFGTNRRIERRECVQCHRGELRTVVIETNLGDKSEPGSRDVWSMNRFDYVSVASISGIWVYGAAVLWYNQLVLNRFKKQLRRNRRKRR